MPLKFSKKADRHRVPRRSSWYVVMTNDGIPFPTNWGEVGLWYEGVDDRGIALEVGTVQRGADEMVIHSMPLDHRHDRNRSC